MNAKVDTRLRPVGPRNRSVVAKVLGLVLGLLLVEGLDRERARAGLQAEEARARVPEQRRQPADAREREVEEDARDEQLRRHVARQLQPRERLLVLERSHADLEVALLHR